VAGSSTAARVAAVATALESCPWREFTDRMLARRVVAAADRHDLVEFVTGLPGTDVGVLGPVDPADVGDARVEAVVRALLNRRWRGAALDRLCSDLVAAIDAWWTARDSFDDGPRWTIGGR
jgi:hypothetical protein